MTEIGATKSASAIVTGGSRGLGRGIVQALSAGGFHVVALARDGEGLTALAREVANVDTVCADAADDLVAGRLLQERKPDLVVLCAGASPPLHPLHLHTWETFSRNWEVDLNRRLPSFATRFSYPWRREATW